MTDSPAGSSPFPELTPLPDIVNAESLSQASALPDLSDLLTRPPPRHSSRKSRVHSPTKSTSSPAESLQASFAPKTFRLADVKEVYERRLKVHKQPLPQTHSRGSVGVTRNHTNLKDSPPSLSHFHTARESSGSPFPIIQRPRGLRDLVPLRSKPLSKATKPLTSRQHHRSATSVDMCRSPYDIHFIRPTIRKNFHLFVDIDLKSSTRPALIVHRASHRKVLSSREKDQKVFKMLNNLLC